jgi:two-component system, sensor histidine kinase and response regulator
MFKTTPLITIFMAISMPFLYAQNAKKLDSLWSVYKNNADTLKLEALTSITEIYRNNKPDSAIILGDLLIELANKANKKKYVAYGYNLIGHAYLNKGDNELALEFYNKALELNKQKNDLIAIGQSYNNMSTIYQKKADYPKTIFYLLESLKIYEQKKGTEVYISNTYNNLARFYASQKNFDKAMDYAQKSLTLKLKINDKKELANTYNNVGIIYRLQKKYDKALEAQFAALEIRKGLLDKLGLAASYTNISNIYQLQKQFDKSISYMVKALAIQKDIGNKEGMEICYTSLTTIYNLQENDSSARKYADSTLMINKMVDNKEINKMALKQVALVQFKEDSFKLAYENLSESKLINDSLFNIENSNIISDVKTKYEVDKKAIELQTIAAAEKKYLSKINDAKLSNEKNQKLAYGSLALLALAGIGFTFYQYKQKQKTNAQLTEINNKINKQNNTLKTLNTELIVSEENLQKSNNSKEQLISMMSHDLLNPITAITNYNQQIISRKTSNEDLLKAFKTVDAAIQPMHSLLDNMLQWTAVQKEGIAAKLKMQDVNEIVKEIISIYRPQANLKFIKINDTLQDDFVMETDKSILSLILRNLLNNAIKYSANNTTINISTSNKTITIQDQGYGMTDEMIGLLNNKQLDKIEAKGTGLGLKLCYEFVEAVGAEINFAKNEDGTNVNIKLA